MDIHADVWTWLYLYLSYAHQRLLVSCRHREMYNAKLPRLWFVEVYSLVGEVIHSTSYYISYPYRNLNLNVGIASYQSIWLMSPNVKLSFIFRKRCTQGAIKPTRISDQAGGTLSIFIWQEKWCSFQEIFCCNVKMFSFCRCSLGSH